MSEQSWSRPAIPISIEDSTESFLVTLITTLRSEVLVAMPEIFSRMALSVCFARNEMTASVAATFWLACVTNCSTLELSSSVSTVPFSRSETTKLSKAFCVASIDDWMACVASRGKAPKITESTVQAPLLLPPEQQLNGCFFCADVL